MEIKSIEPAVDPRVTLGDSPVSAHEHQPDFNLQIPETPPTAVSDSALDLHHEGRVSLNEEQAAFNAHILANRQGYINADIQDGNKNNMATMNKELSDHNAGMQDVQAVEHVGAIALDTRSSKHDAAASLHEKIRDYNTQQEAGQGAPGSKDAEDMDVSG